MITKWLNELDFYWAKDLPVVYDYFLGILFNFIVIPIGIIFDILLFPVEIILWIIRRKGDKENE